MITAAFTIVVNLYCFILSGLVPESPRQMEEAKESNKRLPQSRSSTSFYRSQSLRERQRRILWLPLGRRALARHGADELQYEHTCPFSRRGSRAPAEHPVLADLTHVDEFPWQPLKPHELR